MVWNKNVHSPLTFTFFLYHHKPIHANSSPPVVALINT